MFGHKNIKGLIKISHESSSDPHAEARADLSAWSSPCPVTGAPQPGGGGGGGGVLGALKHPPPKFYNEQARKLLEAVVQVQLHFIHMYGQ